MFRLIYLEIRFMDYLGEMGLEKVLIKLCV